MRLQTSDHKEVWQGSVEGVPYITNTLSRFRLSLIALRK